MQVEVDALLEGSPSGPGLAAPALEALLQRAQADCAAVVPLALAAKKARRPRWPLPALAAVSLVLCDDSYIRGLNAAHRGKDAATDVLSFEVPDEPGEVPPPVKLLGDLVVSLDTAARQAAERGCASL
jgi:probable rRNA maturation factor